MQLGTRHREEHWGVTVKLLDVDPSRGYIAGSMVADVAGNPAGLVETFWEGAIINDASNTFYTGAWGATRSNDLRHWARFDNFEDIRPLVELNNGRCGRLQNHPFIYMRWKEQFFVGSAALQDCGLTIAGFYYVALHRKTGRLQGRGVDDGAVAGDNAGAGGGTTFSSYSFA
eukprot:gene6882-7098_t